MPQRGCPGDEQAHLPSAARGRFLPGPWGLVRCSWQPALPGRAPSPCATDPRAPPAQNRERGQEERPHPLPRHLPSPREFSSEPPEGLEAWGPGAWVCGLNKPPEVQHPSCGTLMTVPIRVPGPPGGGAPLAARQGSGTLWGGCRVSSASRGLEGKSLGSERGASKLCVEFGIRGVASVPGPGGPLW